MGPPTELATLAKSAIRKPNHGHSASAAADRSRIATAYSIKGLDEVVGGCGSDMGRVLPGWTHPNGAGRRLTQRDRRQALGGALGVVTVEVLGDGLGDQLGDLAVEHGG